MVLRAGPGQHPRTSHRAGPKSRGFDAWSRLGPNVRGDGGGRHWAALGRRSRLGRTRTGREQRGTTGDLCRPDPAQRAAPAPARRRDGDRRRHRRDRSAGTRRAHVVAAQTAVAILQHGQGRFQRLAKGRVRRAVQLALAARYRRDPRDTGASRARSASSSRPARSTREHPFFIEIGLRPPDEPEYGVTVLAGRSFTATAVERTRAAR